MNEHEKWLRQVVDGLRRARLNNYANTVEQAADEVRRLQDALDSAVAWNERHTEAQADGI